jgi:hypothetical protein
MKNWTTKEWFIVMTIFAFISVISFFQIDSAWADENNFNGIDGWLGIGLISAAIAIFAGFEAKKIK